MDTEEAKIAGQDLQATLHIGKDGITDSLIEELNKQLDNRELVKVKINRNNPIQDKEDIAEELEKTSQGELVEIRGKTILLMDE